MHCKNKVVFLIVWWLLQLHHVGHVGVNIITYSVEDNSILHKLSTPVVSSLSSQTNFSCSLTNQRYSHLHWVEGFADSLLYHRPQSSVPSLHGRYRALRSNTLLQLRILQTLCALPSGTMQLCAQAWQSYTEDNVKEIRPLMKSMAPHTADHTHMHEYLAKL